MRWLLGCSIDTAPCKRGSEATPPFCKGFWVVEVFKVRTLGYLGQLCCPSIVSFFLDSPESGAKDRTGAKSWLGLEGTGRECLTADGASQLQMAEGEGACTLLSNGTYCTLPRKAGLWNPDPQMSTL